MKTAIITGLREEAELVKALPAVVLCGRKDLADIESLPHDLDLIISFGVCGGVDPLLQVGDLFVNGVIDTIRWALPCFTGKYRGRAMQSDTPQERADLFAKTGARIVDDESEAVADFAAKYNIPFAVIRAVSDDARHCLPEVALLPLHDDGRPDIDSILDLLAQNPFQVFNLAEVAMNFALALRSLERARDVLKMHLS